jgi:hypothetical protein
MDANDIFFSYSHKDRERIEPIINGFKKNGWTVFYDVDIGPNEDWQKIIEARLQTMYAVIVAWSKNSLASDWVKYEATAAANRNRLFSIQLDAELELPELFNKRKPVDFTQWTQDPGDPMIRYVLGPLEDLWTYDNDMALIKDLKVMHALKLRRPSATS